MILAGWLASENASWITDVYQTLFILGITTPIHTLLVFLVVGSLYLLVKWQGQRQRKEKFTLGSQEQTMFILWGSTGLFLSPLIYMGAWLILGYTIFLTIRLWKGSPNEQMHFLYLLEAILFGVIAVAYTGLRIFLWLRYARNSGLALFLSFILATITVIFLGIAQLISSQFVKNFLSANKRKRKVISIGTPLLALFLGVLFLLGIFLPIHPSAPQTQPGSGSVSVRIMTYNIRNAGASETDPLDNWVNRRDDLCLYIENLNADIFGVQEAYFKQVEYIRTQITGKEYTYTGIGRRDGVKGGEWSAIFYDTQRFTLLDGDSFWLSPTPEVPSKQWEKSNYRICTWARFQEKTSNLEFFVFNTHFAEMKYPEVHQKSVELILERIAQYAGNLPVFLLGDFNMVNTTASYQDLTSDGSVMLNDAFKVANNGTAPLDYSFNGFSTETPEELKRIDYIFISGGITVNNCWIPKNSYLTDHTFSDHYPVLLDSLVF